MTDSPEAAVRRFLAAWDEWPKIDRFLSFLAQDAVWVDGPRGVHQGIDAIRSELQEQAELGWGDLTIEVKNLVADDHTVMMERVDHFTVGGKPFSLEVMAAFEVDVDGRIERWRESYDFQSITDQLAASGFRAPSA